MASPFLPTRLPYFFATSLSSAGMSFHDAFGVSSLQYAGKHLEMPTHEQLNSPTIHFSSSGLVPTGEALMKSEVHHRGMGSSPRPRAGMILGRSQSAAVRKPSVRFLNCFSSGL